MAQRTFSLVYLLLLLLPLSCLAIPHEIYSRQSGLDPLARCDPFDFATNVNCRDIFPPSYMVYLNSTYDQAAMDRFAQPFVQQSALARSLNASCASISYIYACIQSFPPCVLANTTSGDVPLPAVPCVEVCDEVNAQCGQLYQLVGRQPIPCLPPPAYDLSAVGGPSSIAPCEDALSFLTPNSSTCPIPGWMDPARNCDPTCPLGKPLFGKKKWDGMVILLGILAWSGLIGSIIVSLLYLLNPTLRRFPGWIIAATGLCFVGLTLSLSMTQWFGVTHLQCDKSRHFACKMQGAAATLFGIGALSFWVVMSIVSCCCLYSANPGVTMDTLRSYQWWSLLVVIFPIFAVLGITFDDYSDGIPNWNSGQVLPVCGPGTPQLTIRWAVSTTLFLLTVGSVAWAASMVQVLRTTVFAKQFGSKGLDLGMQAAMILYELVALVFAGGYSLAFVGLYFRYLNKKFPADTARFLTGATSQKPYLPYGAFIWIIICSAGSAPAWALIFGLRKAHLQFLRRLWTAMSESLRENTTRLSPRTSPTNSGSGSGGSQQSIRPTQDSQEPGIAKLAKFVSRTIMIPAASNDPYQMAMQSTGQWEFEGSGRSSDI